MKEITPLYLVNRGGWGLWFVSSWSLPNDPISDKNILEKCIGAAEFVKTRVRGLINSLKSDKKQGW